MPLTDRSHTRRDRAESFGAVADLYDRYRPSYPDELIDELVALAGDGPVLDIGTGTGKAARLLAARGLDVLGVEIDPLMAEVARRHGLTVEVGSFETWQEHDQRYPLITSAQAWHWVDPRAGAPKAARLLVPGGTFAPFWNFEDVDARELAVAAEVYAELAPELVPANSGGPSRPGDRPHVADLVASGAFESVDSRIYRWSRAYPVEHWVARVGTHSDHLALGPERLAALQAALGSALSRLGPEVHTTGGTYVVLARTAR